MGLYSIIIALAMLGAVPDGDPQITPIQTMYVVWDYVPGSGNVIDEIECMNYMIHHTDSKVECHEADHLRFHDPDFDGTTHDSYHETFTITNLRRSYTGCFYFEHVNLYLNSMHRKIRVIKLNCLTTTLFEGGFE